MKRAHVMSLLAPIPALGIGAVVMRNAGIGFGVYSQNSICYLVVSLLLLLFRRKVSKAAYQTKGDLIGLGIGCLFIALTFLDPGLDRVHRWLGIGGFRFYVSSIVLPYMIVRLSSLLQREKPYLPAIIIVLVVVMLLLQPDASQLSAIALSMIVLVFVQGKHRLFKILTSLVLAGAAFYSWTHLDSLEAVAHVENILWMAWDMGMLWFLLGLLSLIVLILPFFVFFNASTSALAVGVYYVAMIAATFLGNFPVPIMGQGISPVIGYLFVIDALCRRDRS